MAIEDFKEEDLEDLIRAKVFRAIFNAREKARCPESIQNWYQRGFPARCNLNDKPCVLDGGYPCPTYEDWLFEEKQEEVDNIGKKVRES
ncbi:MAG: hypothetical protein V1850_06345 [Candidatus Bathyarchaeota archaeon]